MSDYVIYSCGFNGFKQLKNSEQNAISKAEIVGCGNATQQACSWESYMFIKENTLSISGYCGCSVHLSHNIDISEAIFNGKVKRLINAGNCFGLLMDSGRFSVFRLDCEQSSEAGSDISQSEVCKIRTLFEINEGIDLVDSGFNSNLFLLVTDQGKVESIEATADGSSFNVKSELIMKPKLKQISCGNSHSLALTDNGKVYSWGIGSRGQLGHGDVASRDTPQLVEALDGVTIEKIACGGWHSFALSNTSDLYSWGWNESGQTGFPAPKNTFTTSTTMKKVEAESLSLNSSVHSNKLKEVEEKSELIEETLSESVGVILAPTLLELERHLPTSDSDFLSVQDVACGSRHSAAVISTGEVLTWGWGKYGQLGQSCCQRSGADKTRDAGCWDSPHCPGPVRLSETNEVNGKKVQCGSWNTFIFADHVR